MKGELGFTADRQLRAGARPSRAARCTVTPTPWLPSDLFLSPHPPRCLANRSATQEEVETYRSMGYSEAAAFFGVRIAEGRKIMEATEASESPSADPPAAAADGGDSGGQHAGGQPGGEGGRRLAEIGAAIAWHMILLIVWNAPTFMAVCSRNHHSGAECVGSQDAPFQVGGFP